MPEPLSTLRLASVRGSEENTKFSAQCDAFAVDDGAYGVIRILGCVGSQTAVKSLAAALNASRQVAIDAVNMHPPITPDYGHRVSTYRTDNAYGYTCQRFRLGYDLWHLLAVSKHPGLIPCYTVRSVMHRLLSDAYSTPLIWEPDRPDWGNYVVKKLIEHNKLVKLNCFQCRAGMLTVSSDQLDEIVSEGLSSGNIAICK